jgi:hypothetical protein
MVQRCAHCGTEIGSADKFCRNCGAPVGAYAPAGVGAQDAGAAQTRGDFLELDEPGEHTLAAGYVPPAAPLPYIPEEPAIDPAVQSAPNTLGGVYQAPAAPATVVASPRAVPGSGPENFGSPSGRCPRCGLYLPIYREKCPNCGATAVMLAASESVPAGGIPPKLKIQSYELTKWPVVDFFIGVGTFWLLYATVYINDFAPWILIPITWMVTRLYWRWFARGMGLMMLGSIVATLYLTVVFFKAHPIHVPQVNVTGD